MFVRVSIVGQAKMEITSFPTINWDTHDCGIWTSETTADYAATLVVGAIVGIVIALLMVILTALPLCCGVMKAQGKIIAMVGIPMGIIACFIPLFISLGSCPGFVDNKCAECKKEGINCSDTYPDIINTTSRTYEKYFTDMCHGLGFLIAYVGAWGWTAVVMGITAAALSCCILCGCCKMKADTYADGQAQTTMA